MAGQIEPEQRRNTYSMTPVSAAIGTCSRPTGPMPMNTLGR